MEAMVNDYRRMLDLAIAVLEGDLAPWRLVCQELVDVLGVELAGCFDLRRLSGTMSVVAALPAWVEQMPWAPAEVTAHPLVRHHTIRRDPQPCVSGGVPDDLEWLNSPRFAEARDHFGAASQHLLVPLHGSDARIRYVGGARPDTPYDKHEQGYLVRIQPLLHGIDAHHRELARLRRSDPPDVPAQAPPAKNLGLTPREETVLGLLAEGLTIRAIARRLVISPHTVVKHQQHIYRKMGTGDRLGAVLLAQQMGMSSAFPYGRRQ